MPFDVGSTGDEGYVIEVEDLTQVNALVVQSGQSLITFRTSSNLGFDA